MSVSTCFALVPYIYIITYFLKKSSVSFRRDTSKYDYISIHFRVYLCIF